MGHTPGPWEVNGSLIVKDCYNEVIAETDIAMQFAPKRYVTIETRKANAVLMAAAPELLEALEVALLHLRDASATSMNAKHAFNKVRQAIAKAKGVQS